MTATTSTPPEATTPELVRTARTTGLLYLGLAVTGLVGYMLIRNQLFVAGDPEATMANLIQHESLARLGIVLEMGVVITQALVALWFYRLFRGVNSVRRRLDRRVRPGQRGGDPRQRSTSRDRARRQPGSVADPSGGAASAAQLLYVVSGHLWIVGGIFFGLWLIPMGWLARRSGWMPSLLGWILMIGGLGYVVNAFLTYLIPNPGPAVELLTMPATIGELWMVGYLCVLGIRRP